MYVYFLLLLFHLRLANSNYVTNFLQSNTYLQQPKLPACCDFCGPSAGSIRKKGPEAGKYSQKKMRSQLGILHNTGIAIFISGGWLFPCVLFIISVVSSGFSVRPCGTFTHILAISII